MISSISKFVNYSGSGTEGGLFQAKRERTAILDINEKKHSSYAFMIYTH